MAKVAEDAQSRLGMADLRVLEWLLNPFLIGGREGMSFSEVP